jgi:hypothetical protein
MFQFQTITPKRRRDDDSDSDEERYFKVRTLPSLGVPTCLTLVQKTRPFLAEQFNHGYAQPQHTLPANIHVRPFYTPSRTNFDLQPMTTHSEYGRADSPQPTHGSPFQYSQPTDMDYDMDEDESLDDVRSQPPESPFMSSHFFRPARLMPSSYSPASPISTGRIPTPIHPTFNRGGMNGLGYPSSGAAGAMVTSNPHSGLPSLPELSVGKGRQDMDEDRGRRMPSPISEDDDNIPDTPTALTQSQLSRLSFSHTNAYDSMDTELTAPTMDLPPTPRTRKRSGALTGAPGRFSMGYREDCEKCRQKVPGHYSHFL